MRQSLVAASKRSSTANSSQLHKDCAAAASDCGQNEQCGPSVARGRVENPAVEEAVGPEHAAGRASRRPRSASAMAPSSFSEAPGRSAPTGPSTERKRSARNARPRRGAQPRAVGAGAPGQRLGDPERLAAPREARGAGEELDRPRHGRASRPRRVDDQPPAQRCARGSRARRRDRRGRRRSRRRSSRSPDRRASAPPARPRASAPRRARARPRRPARGMASTFSGAKLPDRGAGQDQLGRADLDRDAAPGLADAEGVDLARRHRRGHPRRRDGDELDAAAPAGRREPVARPAPRASRAGTARRSAAAAPAAASSARPVAAASRKSPPAASIARGERRPHADHVAVDRQHHQRVERGVAGAEPGASGRPPPAPACARRGSGPRSAGRAAPPRTSRGAARARAPPRRRSRSRRR